MSEIAQRETARRVWRLNKKEGVPVRDALETADISKDVYYRIKNEREEEWEEEILTVEQIQKRLAEHGETLEKLGNKAEQVEERLDQVRSNAKEIEYAIESVEEIEHLRVEVQDYGDQLRRLMDRAGIDPSQFKTAPKGPSREELDERVSELEQLPDEIEERFEELERKVGNNEKRSKRAEEKAHEAKEEAPDSFFDLF